MLVLLSRVVEKIVELPVIWHALNDVIMSAMGSQITSVSIVCSIVYSVTDQRKHQSSAALAFVRGILRWPVVSPHKRPVTRKMFPFDDVILLMHAGHTQNARGVVVLCLLWLYFKYLENLHDEFTDSHYNGTGAIQYHHQTIRKHNKMRTCARSCVVSGLRPDKTQERTQIRILFVIQVWRHALRIKLFGGSFQNKYGRKTILPL